MKFTPDKRMSFEMCVIRMLAFSPDVFDHEGADTPSSESDEKKKPLIPKSADPDPAPVPEAEPESVPQPQPALQSEPEPGAELQPEPEPAPQAEPEPEFHEHIPQSQAVPSATSASEQTADALATDIQAWYRLVEQCGISGISANILWNCIPASQTDTHIDLLLDENQSALYSNDQDQHIALALSEVSGRELTVSISKSALNTETPAQRRARIKREAIESLHRSFHNDPGVVALVNTFDASIEQLRTHYERT